MERKNIFLKWQLREIIKKIFLKRRNTKEYRNHIKNYGSNNREIFNSIYNRGKSNNSTDNSRTNNSDANNNGTDNSSARTTVTPTTVMPTTMAPTTVVPTTVAPATVTPTTVASTTAPIIPDMEVDENIKAPEGLVWAGNKELPYYFAWAKASDVDSYNVYVDGNVLKMW